MLWNGQACCEAALLFIGSAIEAASNAALARLSLLTTHLARPTRISRATMGGARQGFNVSRDQLGQCECHACRDSPDQHCLNGAAKRSSPGEASFDVSKHAQRGQGD